MTTCPGCLIGSGRRGPGRSSRSLTCAYTGGPVASVWEDRPVVVRAKGRAGRCWGTLAILDYGDNHSSRGVRRLTPRRQLRDSQVADRVASDARRVARGGSRRPAARSGLPEFFSPHARRRRPGCTWAGHGWSISRTGAPPDPNYCRRLWYGRSPLARMDAIHPNHGARARLTVPSRGRSALFFSECDQTLLSGGACRRPRDTGAQSPLFHNPHPSFPFYSFCSHFVGKCRGSRWTTQLCSISPDICGAGSHLFSSARGARRSTARSAGIVARPA